MYNKLLITGRWVLGKDDQWKLSIDPFIELFNIEAQQLKAVSAFSLVNIDEYEASRKFNKHGITLTEFDNPDQRMSLTNLGDYQDSEGFPYQFFLILEPSDISSNNLKSRYEIYVEDIELDEDEDELDKTIVRILKTFTAPFTVNCSPRINHVASCTSL